MMAIDVIAINPEKTTSHILIVAALGQAVVQSERAKARYSEPFQTPGEEFSEVEIGVQQVGTLRISLSFRETWMLILAAKEEPPTRARHQRYSLFPNLSFENIRAENFDYILITDRTDLVGGKKNSSGL